MFDEILADCLAALENGATLRECLTRYPAQAAALEPLLRLAVGLSRESQTRLSDDAFGQGRRALAAQARARQVRVQRDTGIRHRQPVYAKTASAPQQMPFPSYKQNGLSTPQRALGRTLGGKPQGRLGAPRFLRFALVLFMLISATTFVRQVATSLPGSPLYPVKRSSEHVVGVLMTAAGEEIAWHESQTERRLQELAGLSNTDETTVQTLSGAVESEWQALLTASERLSATERTALLQARLARFQQLEATWVNRPGLAPQMAVTTVRQLITTGAAALATPGSEATAEPIATATVAVPTMTPTVPPTATPTTTPTPLLQPSATAFTLPVVELSPTPAASPTLAPTLLLPPTPAATSLPPTPFPEIPVQMPRQESSESEPDKPNHDEEKADDVNAASPAATVTAPPLTTTPVADDAVATVTPAIATGPEEATTLATETPAPTTADAETPTAAVEGTVTLPTKSPAPTTDTPEPVATDTQRPTSQPAVTKTPKATATQANAESTTPNAATAVSATVAEKTPNATAQSLPTKDETDETPIAATNTPVVASSPTARATTASGEATKVTQP